MSLNKFFILLIVSFKQDFAKYCGSVKKKKKHKEHGAIMM